MSGNSKVVALDRHLRDAGRTDASDVAANNAVHPDSPLSRLRRQTEQQLQRVLLAFFDQSDDTLFELADKAMNNSEQHIYFDAMRDLRLKREVIQTTFLSLLPQGFESVSSQSAPMAEIPVDELSSSELSLVQHDELEEQVALDGMIARCASDGSGSLRELNQRLDAMLTVPIDSSNNPLGPKRICTAFTQACAELDVDIKSRLLIYKLFEKDLKAELDTLYAESNALLKEMGVLPALEHRQAPTRTASGQAVMPGMPQQGGTAPSQQEAAEVFTAMQTLMATRQTMMLAQEYMGNAAWFAPGVAPELPQADLMSLLAQAQSLQLAQPEQPIIGKAAGDSDSVDVHAVLRSLLEQNNVKEQRSLGQLDFDAINLVSMLFQFILDDANLAPVMKAELGRLQIPLLKVAMLDHSFFGDTDHAARKLLNVMATAALGWHPREDDTIDPLQKQVQYTVDTLLSEFDQDVAVFGQLLEEFEHFRSRENKRAELLERRTVDKADAQAKSHVAREFVQAQLSELINAHQLPIVSLKLLREAWAQVLYLCYVRDGADSECWAKNFAVAQELVDATSETSRAPSTEVAHGLVARLEEGLAGVSFDDFQIKGLLNDLQAYWNDLRQLEQEAELRRADAAAQSNGQKHVDDEPIELSALAHLDQIDVLMNEVNDDAKDHAVALSDAANAEVESPELELSEEFAALDDAFSRHEPAADAETAPADAEVVSGATNDAQLDTKVDTGTEPEGANHCTDEDITRAAALTVGSWVRIESDEESFRAKLAARLPATGMCVFVNRHGAKVLELSGEELATDIREGRIVLLNDGALFDRALESVVTTLRATRGEP